MIDDDPNVAGLLENYFLQDKCADEAAQAIIALSKFPVVTTVLFEYFQTRMQRQNEYFQQLKKAGVKSHCDAWELYQKQKAGGDKLDA